MGTPPEGIEASTLREERDVAVLPAAHPLTRKLSRRVRDLHNEPFVLFAALGVSLAPACVANVTMPGAVYREPRAAP
ncbi:MAG TPA: hypothetical protein VMT86_05255 [Bryobacteraceae bacterium]|nr:hypothetical protein [Bryobacteraceae bacterium]